MRLGRPTVNGNALSSLLLGAAFTTLSNVSRLVGTIIGCTGLGLGVLLLFVQQAKPEDPPVQRHEGTILHREDPRTIYPRSWF